MCADGTAAGGDDADAHVVLPTTVKPFPTQLAVCTLLVGSAELWFWSTHSRQLS